MEREFLEGLGMDAQVIEAVLQEHEKTVAAHAEQMAALRLEQTVSQAVHQAGGRNVKAIAALLDMDAIRNSEDAGLALHDALAALKKENGYLFQSTVPPYAPFTGAQEPATKTTTLAGALRERMRRK